MVGECLDCGDLDSVTHTFIHCHFTKVFTEKVIHWFSDSNLSKPDPRTKELLFGSLITLPGPSLKKFNFTLLFMHHYIL